MSQITFFLLLLAGHALGDFYFQSKKMVNMRGNQPKAAFLHTLYYILFLIFVILPVIPFSNESIGIALLLIVTIFLTHAFTDWIKGLISLKQYNESTSTYMWFIKKYVFFFDQAVHIVSLLLLSYLLSGFFAPNIIGARLVTWERSLPAAIPVRPFALIVALMYLIKPTGTAISIFLSAGASSEKRQDSSGTSGFKNAGAIIGVLERLLIFTLLLVEQYGAIGFVFTAKSVARFAEINSQRLEAEYYLIGTFLSLVSVGGIVLLIQLYFR